MRRAAAVTALLVVAACGGSSEESDDTAPRTAATTTIAANDELFTAQDGTDAVVAGDAPSSPTSSVPEDDGGASSTDATAGGAGDDGSTSDDTGGSGNGGADTSGVDDAATGGDGNATSDTGDTASGSTGTAGDTTGGTDGADSGGDDSGGDDGGGEQGAATTGGDDDVLTAGDIDPSVLLDAGELSSLGLGTGWTIEIIVEPAVADPEAPCGLDLLTTVDQLYAPGEDDEGREFEQVLVPGLGAEGVTIVRGFPDCAEVGEQFGEGGIVEELPIAGATAVVFGIDDDVFGERLGWFAADVDGLLVFAFHIGDPEQRPVVDAAFGQLVADVASGV